MILAIDWFGEQFTKFTDSTVYFYIAIVGSGLFGIRLLLMFIGGVDGDADFDIDADGGIEAHGGDFTIFSMLSILSFMMGAGWMGLACRLELGLGSLLSALIAGAFGFTLMLISSFGMYQMKKFNEAGKYDVNTCVGQIGRVYLTIPAKGEGRGRVQVNVQGRQKVLGAVSNGGEIESFAAVKIVGVQEGETVIVEST